MAGKMKGGGGGGGGMGEENENKNKTDKKMRREKWWRKRKSISLPCGCPMFLLPITCSSVLCVSCCMFMSLIIKTALWLSHVIVYWIKENLNTIVINTEPIMRQALLWHSQYCLCRPLLFWLQTVSQDSAQLEEGSKPSGHWHCLYQPCLVHTPPLKQRRSWQSWHREPGNHYRN